MRGVSQVIGALLMVVVVVVAFTSVYVWSLNRFELYRYSLSRLRSDAQHALEEYGVVEYAWIDGDGKLKIYVRNAGEVELCVLDVFINGSLFMRDVGLCVLPGEGGWVNSSETIDGDFLEFKIITEKFNEIYGEAYRVGG